MKTPAPRASSFPWILGCSISSATATKKKIGPISAWLRAEPVRFASPSGACQAPDESARVGRMLELGDGADDGGRLPGVENRRCVPPELLLGFLPREGIGR